MTTPSEQEMGVMEAEHVIRDRFQWLIKNGYRATARSLFDEIGNELRKANEKLSGREKAA